MRAAIASLAMVVCCAAPAGALADPRLDEKVYDPFVEKGALEFDAHGALERGGALGGQAVSVLEVEFGLSDRLSLAVVGAMARVPGAPVRLDTIGLEAVVYLGKIPKIGVDTGVYIEYKSALRGEPDLGEGKLLLAKTHGRFQGLLNLIVEQPIGAPHGQRFAAYGYAASATWKIVGPVRLGAEAFGDLGPGGRGAYIGPQVKWEGRLRRSPVGIAINAGWLAPVGASRRETRGQLRLAVELERRF